MVGGYLTYGTFTQTGLGGWVLAQELEWFGSASQKLTVLLPLVVAMVLPLLLVAPFLPKGERARLAGPLLPQRAARPISWKQLLVFGLVPPLVALPAYYYVQRQAERDESRPVVSLDLVASPAALVPADTKFVRLQAVFQADYQYVLRETSYSQVRKTDRYVPLTGPDWQPGQPVRFFLDTSTDAYFDEANQRTIVFDQTTAFPAVFTGQLHTSALPVVVQREFTRHQVTAAEPYYVLENVYMPNGQPPRAASQQYWLIPVLGIGLGVAILVGGGVGLLIRRKRGLA
ncbi:MAG: hypothetical protein EOO59_11130 [Hymenobacter sp.]|nr:MAG: hypothetical protein EOO59_11130 [Hymenobacter sp.]